MMWRIIDFLAPIVITILLFVIVGVGCAGVTDGTDHDVYCKIQHAKHAAMEYPVDPQFEYCFR